MKNNSLSRGDFRNRKKTYKNDNFFFNVLVFPFLKIK